VLVQVDMKSSAGPGPGEPRPDELLSIGELARRAGRSASAIRYYEQIGLLPEPVRVAGQRRYRHDWVRMLAVIDTAQRAGLSLGEIKIVLGASRGGKDAIGELRRIASLKLPQVTAAIERATLIRKWLERAARCGCPDLAECSLFGGPEDGPEDLGRKAAG
jgi:MerR family redox-sensitive transcriptional activator SoxR